MESSQNPLPSLSFSPQPLEAGSSSHLSFSRITTMVRNFLVHVSRKIGNTLSRQFSARASLSNTDIFSEHVSPDSKKPVLQEISLKGIADYILSGKCRNILVLTGAGISTSAGMPDFRSPQGGLYSKLDSFELDRPERIFDIQFFSDKPGPFYQVAKELFLGVYKPTLSHYFIKMLSEKKLLLRNFTQNIDCLERLAGIEDDYLVEAHGSFHTCHCVGCHKEHSPITLREAVCKGEVFWCDECSSPVKPDIVFFGEPVPWRYHQMVASDFPKCDLLIVMGTSLQVQPFSSLIDQVSSECPRLLINLECVGKREPPSVLGFHYGESSGFHFNNDGNYRDVFCQNSCDEGVLQLARYLGWDTHLQEMYERENLLLEKKFQALSCTKDSSHDSTASHYLVASSVSPRSLDDLYFANRNPSSSSLESLSRLQETPAKT